MQKQPKIIISGGGTGGHIFPALSIANALKEVNSNIDILFVGALGRIEMEKVPNAGYKIIGLPVMGFSRNNIIKNITVIIKLLQSIIKALKIINKFKPDAVVGVGGYASGPVLTVANRKGIPALIQEQNSYAGITNKLLAKKAKKICVAYDGMEKYFPKDKIILTGNPVREDIIGVVNKMDEAFDFFKLDKNKKVILVLGGSLGAKSINYGILENINELLNEGHQVLWQTGKLYYDEITDLTKKLSKKYLNVFDFISEMHYAYSAADLIISRAGAGTISELCIVGKPVILVPSPNVAEDHQTKNAMALANKQAAIVIKDNDVKELLVNKTIEVLKNEDLQKILAENILKLALPGSSKMIADEIIKLIKCN
ncbi:MAG: undecaprenyldiphospho-muramoylpentapeptide beta-N-acetylglucosaminyltransferase [Bacteroidales bacterium]|nr:undecaprenyldiphospho-muramoylpentapeptide beta-N-acetylglucosaminyltransferase [Bacteroidales bacterium]